MSKGAWNKHKYVDTYIDMNGVKRYLYPDEWSQRGGVTLFTKRKTKDTNRETKKNTEPKKGAPIQYTFTDKKGNAHHVDSEIKRGVIGQAFHDAGQMINNGGNYINAMIDNVGSYVVDQLSTNKKKYEPFIASWSRDQ